MRAVVYNGPRDVRVENVPDPLILQPTDALVRITSTNICGSDLHMYEGRTNVEVGKVLGHENLGQVIEVGANVKRVRVGDHVCMPFNIGCGMCENCERGFTSACLIANPGKTGAAYGYAAWARSTAARRSSCACRSPTSTASCCPKAPRRTRATT